LGKRDKTNHSNCGWKAFQPKTVGEWFEIRVGREKGATTSKAQSPVIIRFVSNFSASFVQHINRNEAKHVLWFYAA